MWHFAILYCYSYRIVCLVQVLQLSKMTWRGNSEGFFFFETTAHKQQNNCGAFIDGEELEPEVLSLCWWLKGVLSLLADPHQLASTVLHPDIQKYKTHCHRMTALHSLQFQIDST